MGNKKTGRILALALAFIMLAGCLCVSAEDLTLEEQFRFSCSSAAQQAVYSDGEYIWTASWSETPVGGYTFYKYGLDGMFIECFDIEGVNNVRNMTSDGRDVWCSDGTQTLYRVDLEEKTLLGSLVTEVSEIRHCTYDPTDGGFWVGTWFSLYKIDAHGVIQKTAPALNAAYGSAYDDVTPGGPYLWLFSQFNGGSVLYRYNIADDTISSDTFDISQSVYNYTAGGIYTATIDGVQVLLCNAQCEPNLVLGFVLGCALRYDDNGGEGVLPDPEYNGKVFDTTVISRGGLTCGDLFFGGWNTEADGTGERYMPGDTISVSGSMTLYAEWDSALRLSPADEDVWLDGEFVFNTNAPAGAVVSLDGKPLAPEAYTLNADRGTITLAASLRESFAAAKHTLTVDAAENSVSADFEVIIEDETGADSNPATGDALPVVAALAAGSLFFLVLMKRKKAA